MAKNELIVLSDERSLVCDIFSESFHDIVKSNIAKPLFSFNDKIFVLGVAQSGNVVHLFSRYSVKTLVKCDDGRYRVMDISTLPAQPISKPIVMDNEIFYLASGGIMISGKLSGKLETFGLERINFKNSIVLDDLKKNRMILDLYIDERRIIVLTTNEVIIIKRENESIDSRYGFPMPLVNGVIRQNEIMGLSMYGIWLWKFGTNEAKAIVHKEIPLTNLRGFDYENLGDETYRIIMPNDTSIYWLTCDADGKIIEWGNSDENDTALHIRNVRFVDRAKCVAVCSNYTSKIYEFQAGRPVIIAEYGAPGKVIHVTNDMHAILSNGYCIPLSENYLESDIEIASASYTKRSVYVSNMGNCFAVSNRRLRFCLDGNIQTREIQHFNFSERIPEALAVNSEYCILNLRQRILITDHEGEVVGTFLPEKNDFVSTSIYDDFVSLCYRDKIITYGKNNGIWCKSCLLSLGRLRGFSELTAGLYTGKDWFVAGSGKIMRWRFLEHKEFSPAGSEIQEVNLLDKLFADDNDKENEMGLCLSGHYLKKKLAIRCTYPVRFNVYGLAYRGDYLLAWGENQGAIIKLEYKDAEANTCVMRSLIRFTLPEQVTGMDFIESEGTLFVILASPSGLWRYDCSLKKNGRYTAVLSRRYYEEEMKFYKLDYEKMLIDSNDFDNLISLWECRVDNKTAEACLQYSFDSVFRTKEKFLHKEFVVL